MESDTTGDILPLTIRFATVLQDPFGGKYKLTPIHLDPALFTDEGLKSLKSLTIISRVGSDSPDLEINSVFELSINTKSRGYERILKEEKPGPPIKDEVFYKIEDKHKTLTYAIVKYIAWRYGLHIDEPHTKAKESTMGWEFNGVSSKQSPLPQWIITGYYEEVQSHIFDFSGIDFRHFYKLYDAGLEIPLHQELLTEVNSLMYSPKRRSTYLILYTTLEVATKTLIRTLKPETDYLIRKMQSPELYKLYTEYINVEIKELVTSEEAKTLKNMATIRNGIAHSGEGVTMDVLSRHFTFVSSLIKKIDNAMGYV